MTNDHKSEFDKVCWIIQQSVQRCGLLLETSHVAWSVCLCVCLSVCVGYTGELCKYGWTDENAVWGGGGRGRLLWAKKHVLNNGQDGTNPFAVERSDMTAMRPFAKLLWTLVYNAGRICRRKA